MSELAFAGAVELGLIFGFVALGIFISFRVLDFPDLTVDGSFPLGAACTAAALVSGWHPVAATALSIGAGLIAGLCTGMLALRFKILGLLAGILTMTALYSINLRIMGGPNTALLNLPTVFSLATLFQDLGPWSTVSLLSILMFLTLVLLWAFLSTDAGLGMRATGANARMARAQGVDTTRMTYVGLMMSNGLIALGGSLFAQANGFADVTSGIGTIVIGLASVILGETLHRSRLIAVAVVATVAGSILYRLAVQFALSSDSIGLRPSDLSLITATLVAVTMVLSRVKGTRASLRGLLGIRGAT